MRLTEKDIQFEVGLDGIYGILPNAPKDLMDFCVRMSRDYLASSYGRPKYIGIDPDKQTLETLVKPLPIIGEEGEHVVIVQMRAYPGNEKKQKFVKRRFPRYGIRIKNNEIIAITQAVKDDMNVLNQKNYYLDWAFDPSSLETTGEYTE